MLANLGVDAFVGLQNSRRQQVSLHPPTQRILSSKLSHVPCLTLRFVQNEFKGCRKIGAAVFTASSTKAALRAVRFTQQFFNLLITDFLEEPNVLSFYKRLHAGYKRQLASVESKYKAELAEGRVLLPLPNHEFPPLDVPHEDPDLPAAARLTRPTNVNQLLADLHRYIARACSRSTLSALVDLWDHLQGMPQYNAHVQCMLWV